MSSPYDDLLGDNLEAEMPDVAASDKLRLVFSDEDDHKELSVHKCVLCLASSVFRDLLNTEPQLDRHAVDGTEDTWLAIIARIYPVRTQQALAPDEVLRIVPLSRFYDFRGLLADCIAAASGFSYNLLQDLHFQVDPVPFLVAAERFQVPELATGPFQYLFQEYERNKPFLSAKLQEKSSVLGPFYKAALSFLSA